MAMEFKDWDRKMSQYKGELKLTAAERAAGLAAQIDALEAWPFEVSSWNITFVRHCVYEAGDAAEWQRFRVGLKGLSTPVKIHRLMQRYAEFVGKIKPTNQEEAQMRRIQMCRIDNYIGALKRGGQLDDKLRLTGRD